MVAIVDPPRTGLAPSVCCALRANPLISRVIMVSCNPLAKRLRQDYVVHGGSFLENAMTLVGPKTVKDTTTVVTKKRRKKANAQPVLSVQGEPFVPVFAVPVDMFPMTPHVELLMVFDRPTSIEPK